MIATFRGVATPQPANRRSQKAEISTCEWPPLTMRGMRCDEMAAVGL